MSEKRACRACRHFEPPTGRVKKGWCQWRGQDALAQQFYAQVPICVVVHMNWSWRQVPPDTDATHCPAFAAPNDDPAKVRQELLDAGY